MIVFSESFWPLRAEPAEEVGAMSRSSTKVIIVIATPVLLGIAEAWSGECEPPGSPRCVMLKDLDAEIQKGVEKAQKTRPVTIPSPSRPTAGPGPGGDRALRNLKEQEQYIELNRRLEKLDR